MDHLFTVAWVVWIAAFGVIEGIALRRKERGDTLSEHVWAVLRRPGPWWFLAAGFLVWLTAHFLGFGIV